MGNLLRDVMMAVIRATDVDDGAFICERDELKFSSSQLIEDHHSTERYQPRTQGKRWQS